MATIARSAMTRRSRATSSSRRASRYSASSVIRQSYPARPCPVEPLILALQIRKRGTFSTFGGTPADLQQRTHHRTHPPADRYLGERSRGRCRPNLKPAPVAPDRFEPRRTTMSTTSHPLHRELPHADDELMTIKGGGHTRPGPRSDTALLAPPRHWAARLPDCRISTVMTRCGVSRPTATSWLSGFADGGLLQDIKVGRVVCSSTASSSSYSSAPSPPPTGCEQMGARGDTSTCRSPPMRRSPSCEET